MVSSISGSSSSDYLAYLLEQLAESTSTSTTTSALSTASKSTSSSNTDDIFAKLSDAVGGDGKTITKDELESYIKQVESDTTGKYDKGSLGFLTQLDKNWDNISGGSDSITESDLEAGMSYLQPPTSSSDALVSDLFTALAGAVDSNGDGSISLSDLTSYLKSLTSSSSDSTSGTANDNNSDDTSASSTSSTNSTSDTELANEIKLISNLISNFDSFSDGSGNITSNSFYSALNEPQDPSTITSDQLMSPIDIKV